MAWFSSAEQRFAKHYRRLMERGVRRAGELLLQCPAGSDRALIEEYIERRKEEIVRMEPVEHGTLSETERMFCSALRMQAIFLEAVQKELNKFMADVPTFVWYLREISAKR